MHKKSSVSKLFLAAAYVLLHAGCFKAQVVNQVKMQDALITPAGGDKCWVLRERADRDEIKYWVSYYKHAYIERTSLEGYSSFQYADGTYETDTLTGDFISHYKRDNDLHDCDDGLDVDDPIQSYVRAADRPDFLQKHTVNYEQSSARAVERLSNAANGTVTDSAAYYYEELYFEATGAFQKKIFPDAGCNPVLLTGRWRFRTPFANRHPIREYVETELILEYDNYHGLGLPPRGKVYVIRQYVSENGNFGSFELTQKESAVDSTSLDVRGHYTIVADDITYAPARVLSSEFAAFRDYAYGKPQQFIEAVCDEIPIGQPDDRLQIYDPLMLLRGREYATVASYTKGTPRCGTGGGGSGGGGGGSCAVKWCGRDVCGDFTGILFDEDDQPLNLTHPSTLTLAADSSTLTISNFANLGQPVTIPMPGYVWQPGYCMNHEGFQTTLGNTQVIFVGLFTGQNHNGKDIIYAECRLNNVFRYVHYEK